MKLQMYHVIDKTTAVCGLGDACWVDEHYPTEGEAKQQREVTPNWNPRLMVHA